MTPQDDARKKAAIAYRSAMLEFFCETQEEWIDLNKQALLQKFCDYLAKRFPLQPAPVGGDYEHILRALDAAEQEHEVNERILTFSLRDLLLPQEIQIIRRALSSPPAVVTTSLEKSGK